MEKKPPLERHNTFVRVQGVPDRGRTVILDGRWSRHHAIFRLLGAKSGLFVAQPRKHRMPPESFSDAYEGRLLRMADQDYFPQLYRYFVDNMRTVIDLPPADLLRHAGQAPVELRGRRGEDFSLRAKDELFVSVEFPGEYRVQFDRALYPKERESDKVMASLGLEWGPLEDSGAFRSYLVHADAEQASALMARFQDVTLKVGVVPRAEPVRCQWGDVKRDGDRLVLKALDDPAPAPFAKAEDGLLKPAEPTNGLALTPDRIRSVEVQVPLRIPKDAMILRQGDTPGTFWWVAAADVLLLGLIAINLTVLLRRRQGSAR